MAEETVGVEAQELRKRALRPKHHPPPSGRRVPSGRGAGDGGVNEATAEGEALDATGESGIAPATTSRMSSPSTASPKWSRAVAGSRSTPWWPWATARGKWASQPARRMKSPRPYARQSMPPSAQ